MVVNVQGKNIRFKANRFAEWPDFHFYENGNLSEGTLAEETEFEFKGRTITVLEGFLVRFDEKGGVTGFQS